MRKLYDIAFAEGTHNKATETLYYRSSSFVTKDDSGINVLRPYETYDFFTYFNALSIDKWVTYTNAEKIRLVIDFQGEFNLVIYGGYIRNNGVQKELIEKKRVIGSTREKRKFELPCEGNSSVIGFLIETYEETFIYDCYYECDIKEEFVSEPEVALVTTTYNKQSYIKKNVEVLKKDIFNRKPYSEHFKWNIIDNGQNLELINAPDQITIIPNPNIGGAGGFSRGIVESLRQDRDYSFILLMDDDVVISPESIKRLYVFLSMLKPQYSDFS